MRQKQLMVTIFHHFCGKFVELVLPAGYGVLLVTIVFGLILLLVQLVLVAMILVVVFWLVGVRVVMLDLFFEVNI